MMMMIMIIIIIMIIIGPCNKIIWKAGRLTDEKFENKMRVSLVCAFAQNSYISGKYAWNCKRVTAQMCAERRVNL